MYYNKCLNISSGKWSDPGSLFKVSIYNLSGLKNYKKGYKGMTEKNYLEILRSVLCHSISHYFKEGRSFCHSSPIHEQPQESPSLIRLREYFPWFKRANWNRKFEFVYLRPLDRNRKKQIDPRRKESNIILRLNIFSKKGNYYIQSR